MVVKKVLITGVSGLVGGVVFRRLQREPQKYEVYGLDRSEELSARAREADLKPIPAEWFYKGDIFTGRSLKKAIEGKNIVVHLAADPNIDAGWSSVFRNNIVGTWNVFRAARRAGVQRIIFGSSLFVTMEPKKPYSVGKAWGERLALRYTDKYGLSCKILRIGAVNPDDQPGRDPVWAACWGSHDKIGDWVERCLGASEGENHTGPSPRRTHKKEEETV